MSEILFWISLGVIFYTYFGYPLLLWVGASLFRKRHERRDGFPSVSMVVAAWNEEGLIRKKIENLLSQNYPKGKIELIIVSDGSTDRTNEILKEFASLIRYDAFEEHRGKAAALNKGVELARGEIIVFADVRQEFEPDAVKNLAANFADKTVGSVSGELVLRDQSNAVGEAIDFYWNYEKWIRNKESCIDSMVGATGAIYAIRKGLYRPIPSDTILDDVLIPMQIVLVGYRAVFEPTAIAYDRKVTHYQAELRRKIRTLAGNYQILLLCPALLNPFRNRLFFFYLSHKILRLLIPFFLIFLLTANLFLSGVFYRFFLMVQLAAYCLGIAGTLLQREKLPYRIVTVPAAFLVLNYAAMMGFVHYLRSNGKVWIKN